MRIFVALVVLAVMVAPAMAVIVANPGFEAGTAPITVPPSWTAYGRTTTHMTDPPSTIHVPGVNNQATYQGAGDDRSPEGSRSYSAQGAGNSGGIYQVVDTSAVKGKAATLSGFTFWGRGALDWHEFGIIQGTHTDPDSLGTAKVWAWKTDGWGQNGWWNNGSGTTGTATSVDAGFPDNWMTTSVNFTIPDANTMTIYIKSGSSSALAASWLDNVVLTPEPAAAMLLLAGLPLLLRRRR